MLLVIECPLVLINQRISKSVRYLRTRESRCSENVLHCTNSKSHSCHLQHNLLLGLFLPRTIKSSLEEPARIDQECLRNPKGLFFDLNGNLATRRDQLEDRSVQSCEKVGEAEESDRANSSAGQSLSSFLSVLTRFTTRSSEVVAI